MQALAASPNLTQLSLQCSGLACAASSPEGSSKLQSLTMNAPQNPSPAHDFFAAMKQVTPLKFESRVTCGAMSHGASLSWGWCHGIALLTAVRSLDITFPRSHASTVGADAASLQHCLSSLRSLHELSLRVEDSSLPSACAAVDRAAPFCSKLEAIHVDPLHSDVSQGSLGAAVLRNMCCMQHLCSLTVELSDPYEPDVHVLPLPPDLTRPQLLADPQADLVVHCAAVAGSVSTLQRLQVLYVRADIFSNMGHLWRALQQLTAVKKLELELRHGYAIVKTHPYRCQCLKSSDGTTKLMLLQGKT